MSLSLRFLQPTLLRELVNLVPENIPPLGAGAGKQFDLRSIGEHLLDSVAHLVRLPAVLPALGLYQLSNLSGLQHFMGGSLREQKSDFAPLHGPPAHETHLFPING